MTTVALELPLLCQLGLHHWADPVRDPTGTWVTCCDECLQFEFVNPTRKEREI